MAVNGRTLHLAQQLRSEIGAIADAQTRDLVRRWVTAWDDLEAELMDTMADLADTGPLSRSKLSRSIRLREALDTAADQLQDLTDYSDIRIRDDLPGVVRSSAQAQSDIIASQLPPGQAAALEVWTKTSDRQLIAIVERSAQQITSLHKPLAPEAAARMRSELVRGVAVGANPRETARRMVNRSEVAFNGGLNRAMVISRTETLDAYRVAAAAEQAEQADVLKGWQWVAELDERTCPSCWANHGKVYDLETPGPLDHQQGRCARVPVTKSWEDLGIEGMSPEPDDLVPDAEDAFNALSPDEQLAIMGRRRLELLQNGDISWGDLTTLRTTTGWRDSYGVAPVKNLTAGR